MIPAVPAMLMSDGLFSSSSVSVGLSEEANTLQTESRLVRQHLWESISIREVVATALSELDRARAEAAHDGWDGPGSRAIDIGAYVQARQFVFALPTGTAAPSISVDSDGEVDVAWDFDRDHVFSISISRTGRLAYAGLLGGERHSGRAHFVNEIPRSLLGLLAVYFSRPR